MRIKKLQGEIYFVQFQAFSKSLKNWAEIGEPFYSQIRTIAVRLSKMWIKKLQKEIYFVQF